MLAHVPVDHVDCQKESFWKQFEVVVDLNKPINKRWSNSFINFKLLTHIIRISIPLLLSFKHVIMNLMTELSYVVDVAGCLFVYLRNVHENLVFAPLMEHLQLLVQTNAWEFVARCCSVCWARSLLEVCACYASYLRFKCRNRSYESCRSAWGRHFINTRRCFGGEWAHVGAQVSSMNFLRCGLLGRWPNGGKSIGSVLDVVSSGVGFIRVAPLTIVVDGRVGESVAVVYTDLFAISCCVGFLQKLRQMVTYAWHHICSLWRLLVVGVHWWTRLSCFTCSDAHPGLHWVVSLVWKSNCTTWIQNLICNVLTKCSVQRIAFVSLFSRVIFTNLGLRTSIVLLVLERHHHSNRPFVLINILWADSHQRVRALVCVAWWLQVYTFIDVWLTFLSRCTSAQESLEKWLLCIDTTSYWAEDSSTVLRRRSLLLQTCESNSLLTVAGGS